MRISDWSSDVCSSDLTKVTRDTYDPFPYYGYGAYWYRRPYFGHPSPHTYRYKRTTYLAELTVEPFTGIAPGAVGKVYRAREVLHRLAPPIGRQEDQPHYPCKRQAPSANSPSTP